MKIEINDKELIDEFSAKLKASIKAIAKEKAEGWAAKDAIKKAIEVHFQSAIDVIVADMLKELPELRDQVRKELIEKMKRQLSAALKKQGDLI